MSTVIQGSVINGRKREGEEKKKRRATFVMHAFLYVPRNYAGHAGELTVLTHAERRLFNEAVCIRDGQ